MFIVCLKCFEIYNGQYIYSRDKRAHQCPKANCIGDIVVVDDFMVNTIVALNEKGYKTTYCCSGHVSDINADFSSCCIRFSGEMESHIKNNIPDGFAFFKPNREDSFPEFQIVFDIKGHSKGLSFPEKLRLIAETNISVFNWAISLPPII